MSLTERTGTLRRPSAGGGRYTTFLHAFGRAHAPAPLDLGASGLDLDPAARKELQRRYAITADAAAQTRYQMVLLAGEGYSARVIASDLGCSPATVWRVLQRYRASGVEGLAYGARYACRGMGSLARRGR
jgi:DNA-directed RNA polymerase specialized sigma24 family protein